MYKLLNNLGQVDNSNKVIHKNISYLTRGYVFSSVCLYFLFSGKYRLI